MGFNNMGFFDGFIDRHIETKTTDTENYYTAIFDMSAAFFIYLFIYFYYFFYSNNYYSFL